MFLSIATTHQPATDLGFLLHKHPGRLHEFELTFGKAFVFFPEAGEARCEAALVLDVDPVGLVRGKGQAEGLLDQYVNDRPYAASSFLSVALNRAFRTAMTGTCEDRPDIAGSAIPLEAVVTPLPMRGGDDLVRALFEPLGWQVTVDQVTVDQVTVDQVTVDQVTVDQVTVDQVTVDQVTVDQVTVDQVAVDAVAGPDGARTRRRYGRLKLTGSARLSALLGHLYVLIPVLDDSKHYWIGEDEVDKLLKRGEGWLEQHPAKELIARRYLGHRRSLTRTALERLAPEAGEEENEPEARDAAETALETPIRLNDERMIAVVTALHAAGACTIADLGCGEGKLLQRLLRERWAGRLIGLDPAARTLEMAARRLKLHQAGGPPEGRVLLLHGSLTYRDPRWAMADAAALVEVIEHLDPDRLPLMERVVFGEAHPATVIVTTPNAEYNALFPNFTPGAMRHPDHRFEWTRAEFRTFAGSIESRYGYQAAISGIGREDETLGAPTQMAVFTR
jgi:3' terminal RNA ribose 2'-O-methyltransferase Hen1